MTKICLNMIVKNESAKIFRCLEAIAPHIDCYAIVDTGSTDGTLELLTTFFQDRNIRGVTSKVTFENFSQARNRALELARQCNGHEGVEWDYLLFCDADMQLVVDDPDWKEKLVHPTYSVVQKGGNISYHNTRLVHKDVTAVYRGATHEYFDGPVYEMCQGIWYLDHADGANRPDKYARDIRLLRGEIQPTERAWFYLAQTYRDSGEHVKAINAYRTRMELGGWDEEVWYSQFTIARILRDMGDEAGFVHEALLAFDLRPSRAEPLYDLAQFYRNKGKNSLAVLYAEMGLSIPRPVNDVLFVEDYPYHTGLLEEFAISAFYLPNKRERGFAVCSQLALSDTGTDQSREVARTNLLHYMHPLAKHLPTFWSGKIDFTPPDGFIAMNPSVTRLKNKLVANIRCVNYSIINGQYFIRGTDGTANGTNPINTRNFYVELNSMLKVDVVKEILLPVDWPAPKFDLVIGAEDLRLFQRNGDLYGSACVRELAADGYCEQVIFKIVPEGDHMRMCDWHKMLPAKREYEKNWMPVSTPSNLAFIYRLGHTVNEFGVTINKQTVPKALDHISGGSQAIRFQQGFLALVHEARYFSSGQRYYQHRFVWFDSAMEVRRISLPFYFDDKQIEFAAGIANHPDGKRIVMSYGVRDEEAHIAVVDPDDIVKFIWKEVS